MDRAHRHGPTDCARPSGQPPRRPWSPVAPPLPRILTARRAADTPTADPTWPSALVPSLPPRPRRSRRCARVARRPRRNLRSGPGVGPRMLEMSRGRIGPPRPPKSWTARPPGSGCGPGRVCVPDADHLRPADAGRGDHAARCGARPRTPWLVADGANVASSRAQSSRSARQPRHRLPRAAGPGSMAARPLRVHVVAGEARVDDRLPDAARLTDQPRSGSLSPGTAAPLSPSPAHDRLTPGSITRRADFMTSTQTLQRSARHVAAVVVAIAVRPDGPVRRPASDTPATHTITVSATGKTTVVPDVARPQSRGDRDQVDSQGRPRAGAKAMTDIIAALKGSASPTPTSDHDPGLCRGTARPDPEGCRLPDQRASPGDRPRHRQGR